MLFENIGLIIAFIFSLLTIYLLHEDYAQNKLSKKKYIMISVMEGIVAIGAIILILI